ETTPHGHRSSHHSRGIPHHPTQARHQLVTTQQSLAHALRHRLLRHRAHGHRLQPLRPCPFRSRGHAIQPAPERPPHRRRTHRHQNHARPPTHLHADGRAPLGHLHGRLRLHRRRLRYLRLHPGLRPVHPRRCLC